MSEGTVRPGTVVSIKNTLLDQNADLYEFCEIPVSYVHGSGAELFPRVEQALDGRKSGDQVEVSLGPEDGFAYPDPELGFSDAVVTVPEQ